MNTSEGYYVRMQTPHGQTDVFFANHGKKEAVKAAKGRFPQYTGHRVVEEGE